jgi:hypothetical protein
MKISELVTPSLGAAQATAPASTGVKPTKVMNKFMSKAAQAGSSIKNYMTGQPSKDSLSGKLGGALASMNKVGVADYSKTGTTKDNLNQFASVLMQADTPEADVVAPMKLLLANPQDATAKKQVIDNIEKLLADPRFDISHADFNSEYRTILNKFNIKPQDFKDTKSATTQKQPGTSTILNPKGNPF